MRVGRVPGGAQPADQAAQHHGAPEEQGQRDRNGVNVRPRVQVKTLGVDDLEKSLTFYSEGLGLPTQGIIGTEFEDGDVVFFEMNDDLVLALYPRSSLAKYARVPEGQPSAAEPSVGHIVGSK